MNFMNFTGTKSSPQIMLLFKYKKEVLFVYLLNSKEVSVGAGPYSTFSQNTV